MNVNNESSKGSRYLRPILVSAALLALSASERLCNYAFEDWLRARVPAFAETERLYEWLFLLEAGLLVILSPRACGLHLGALAQWRQRAGSLLFVWLLPPLLVLLVYAHLTTRPFHGAPPALWLISSAAQELFFTGFVFARLADIFDKPGSQWADAFSAPQLLTPLCFALWHWPNFRSLDTGYAAFQFIYTFLGGWWLLHIRRWTGCIWPGIANHVLVNWLASSL